MRQGLSINILKIKMTLKYVPFNSLLRVILIWFQNLRPSNPGHYDPQSSVSAWLVCYCPWGTTEVFCVLHSSPCFFSKHLPRVSERCGWSQARWARAPVERTALSFLHNRPLCLRSWAWGEWEQAVVRAAENVPYQLPGSWRQLKARVELVPVAAGTFMMSPPHQMQVFLTSEKIQFPERDESFFFLFPRKTFLAKWAGTV